MSVSIYNTLYFGEIVPLSLPNLHGERDSFCEEEKSNLLNNLKIK